MKSIKKILCILLAVLTIASVFSVSVSAYAASATPKTVYSKVQKAYGKSFPLKSGAKKMSYTELNVSKKYISSYVAYQKGTKDRRMIFIAKAKSTANAKSIKKQLTTYLNYEKHNGYLNATGKKVVKNAKIGIKGKYVYIVMLDTTGNKKAITAINKYAK